MAGFGVTAEATLEKRKQLAGETIANVLAAYDAERGTTKFAVTTSDDSFHVIPTESKDASGNLRKKVQPLLDTSISIGNGEQSVVKYMADIAKAISANSGVTPVWAGTMPTPLFYQSKADVMANNEPAWKVLTRLLSQIPVGYFPEGEGNPQPLPTTLSWTFLCDPDGECAINVHVVSPGGKATIGMSQPKATDVNH